MHLIGQCRILTGVADEHPGHETSQYETPQ